MEYLKWLKPISFILFAICIGVLLYTRLVNLGWGLPYPMHPDERNMAIALQQLNCKEFSVSPSTNLRVNNTQSSIKECFNPHFFAYGQFPLYLGYGVVGVMKFFDGDIGTPIGFEEATIALRIISAVASIINVWILIKIIELLRLKVKNQKSKMQVESQKSKTFDFLFSLFPFAFILLTFSPYFIQYSHFGTTESLLMLCFSSIVLLSLKTVAGERSLQTFIFLCLASGIALATKISSVIFLFVPLLSFAISRKKQQATEVKGILTTRTRPTRGALAGMKPLTESVVLKIEKKHVNRLILLFFYLFFTALIATILSPHNLISFTEFRSTIQYESSVAIGSYIPFYTRQFVNTFPVLFQSVSVFPYTLGWPVFTFFLLGFFLLSWKNSRINLLRASFIVFFLPNAFVFAKWTRFMAPVFPIMSVFAILFINILYEKLKVKSQKSPTFNFLLSLLPFVFLLLTLIPGLAYLSIYQNPDVRFTASDWIFKNIPADSRILSETANVIDIPVPTQNNIDFAKSYQYTSFYYYDLDTQISLQNSLAYQLQNADYVFIPSRRIFANHTCVRFDSFQEVFLTDEAACKKAEQTYPLLNRYYQDLVSGKSGFELVKTFTSFPRITFLGRTLLEFPDESAEESFTVFDHPIIRIYKRKNLDGLSGAKSPLLDFSNYQTINYKLGTVNYSLLVADTPTKWEKGLMYVRNKEDIGGRDGMIFIFPETAPRNFWNKNTVIDLDLYWLKDNAVVGTSVLPSIENGSGIVSVNSPKPVNAVIELIKESP